MKKQIPVIGTWSGAEAIAERVKSELDASYTLVSSDYDGELSRDIVKILINDGREAAQEKFYDDNHDWISDAEWGAMDEIIREHATDDEIDQLNEFEYYGILQDEIYSRDDSDIFTELMNRTGRQWMVYDLGLTLDAPSMEMVPHDNYGQVSQAIPAERKKLADHLNVADSEKLAELIDNAGYGGDVQLLLDAHLDEFDALENGKEYTFDNVAVAIIDYTNGSGHDVFMDGITITWDRSKLKFNDFYAEDVCGLIPAPYSNFTVKEA